ncbi:putative cation diffusion facilitator family transporter [Magnetofaba australis IT-1]|uniref:Putative cation diffusion facilitator family transporter n=1 Tax=Magnetofaba australis IT-1 TaxID=1434232 RepID=A0A1Y2K059_9PROT|nr:putative cation diffusion facilitator family transporter [Magnetofaba australis IT-1]
MDLRFQASDRCILIGAIVNILLSVGKVAAGIIGNSAALVADGVHSASDLVSDAVVWLSSRIARQAPDEEHPYGHGRYETLAILMIGLLLLGVAVGIVIDAVGRIEDVKSVQTPTMLALAAVIVSIISKEGLFHYTKAVGEKHKLRSLIANAWHHRSDAVSSIAAMVGIVGAQMGWPVLDPVAAAVVAAILAKVSYEFIRDAMREFTESASAVDKEIQERINAVIEGNTEVRSLHLMKARRAGPDVYVEIHLVVNAYLSVSEGHQIAENIRMAVVNGVSDVTDVLVHIDPEDDSDKPMPVDYPQRKEIRDLIKLELRSAQNLTDVQNLILHYTRDGIVADMTLIVAPHAEDAVIRQESQALCRRLIAAQPRICNVRASQVIAALDRDAIPNHLTLQ